ncbi:MAG: hypothetical protein C0403_14055 [Desulfobacterium sp.]|nr:hypothetical protein [Desulfobacterium sp.]
MYTHEIKQAVFTAVSETFEAMIFTQIIPSDLPDIGPTSSELIEANTETPDSDLIESAFDQPVFYRSEINLIEPKSALFSMIFPTDLAISITKNLYGWMEENDPPEHLMQDSLAEIINTVTGKLMTILIDNQSTFTLGLPNLKIMKDLSFEKGEVYSFSTTDNFRFFFIIEGDLLPEE